MRVSLGIELCCGLLAAHAIAQTPGSRLLDAATRRDLKDLREALAKRAPVDTRDDSGRTALLIALQGSASEYRVIGADEPVARFLVEKGAGINVQDNQGWSPLAKLVDQSADQPALVQYLLDHGANVNARLKDGRTPLRIAARLGREDRVRLLDHHANINAQDKSGQNALMRAIDGPECSRCAGEHRVEARADAGVCCDGQVIGGPGSERVVNRSVFYSQPDRGCPTIVRPGRTR